MLKKSASVVLASLRGSTYETYASPLLSLRPCWTAILSILRLFCYPPSYVRFRLRFMYKQSFSAACWTRSGLRWRPPAAWQREPDIARDCREVAGCRHVPVNQSSDQDIDTPILPQLTRANRPLWRHVKAGEEGVGRSRDATWWRSVDCC